MGNYPVITLKVKGFLSETSFKEDCSPVECEKELQFLISRHGDGTATITLNIDDKQAYLIDAEVATKILELTNSIYKTECPECFAKGTIIIINDNAPELINCPKCNGKKYI